MTGKLHAPLTENKITRHWRYKDKVYISLVCITYNQASYIRDTIDSLLAQQCEFKFEILIHDDCSTDDTRNILLEYKDKYPNIIRLVLQEENQYSKNRRVTPIAVSYSYGDYITVCEGDDFWIDKYKVQKQISQLLKHKEIELCFTSGYHLIGELLIKKYNYGSQHKVFHCREVIKFGGSFIPTASWMMSRRVFDELPCWFYEKTTVGDYFLQILSSMNGGALYLSDRTVVYRVNAIGSWSSDKSSTSAKHRDKSSNLYIFLMELYPQFSKEFYFILNKSNLKYFLACLKSKSIANSLVSAKLMLNYFAVSSKCLILKSGLFK